MNRPVTWFVNWIGGARNAAISAAICVVVGLLLLAYSLFGGGSGEPTPATAAATTTPAAAETPTAVITRAVAPTSMPGVPPGMATPVPVSPTPSPTPLPPAPTPDTSAWDWWVDLYRDVEPEDYNNSDEHVPVAAFAAPCVCGEWLGTVPVPELQDAKWWVARFEADLHFPKGIYRFNVSGIGSVRFFADNDLVFEAWPSDRNFDEVVSVRFDETGEHKLVYEIVPTELGVAKAHLSWEELVRRPTEVPTETPVATPTTAPEESPTPAPTPSVGVAAWQADVYLGITPEEYQDNGEFDPAVSFQSVEVKVDLSSLQEVLEGVPVVDVSRWILRYEADLEFPPGNYQFQIDAEGSVRLFVDDELIVEQWPSDDLHQELVEVELDGVHNLVFELAPTSEGAASAQLTWTLVP